MPDAKEDLFPLERGANPRRALVVSLTQSLANLVLFLALYWLGVLIGVWPRFETVSLEAIVSPGVQRGLLISFLLSVLMLFAYRYLLPRIVFKPYYDAVVLLRAGYPDQGVETLNRFIDRIADGHAFDRFRSLLMLDYSEYSFLETALLTLAYAHVGQGQRAEAEAAFRRVLGVNPENVTAQEALEDLDLVMRQHGPVR